MLTKELLSEYIDAGAAKRKADMAILGGTLINVNTSEYYQADVAIYKGKIVAVESDKVGSSGPTVLKAEVAVRNGVGLR